MKLHDDLHQPVHLHSDQLPWVDSPMPGVQRRMLERVGDEVARATSIVRYAPGSHFSAHVHSGGEEFLVLEGVFSDESGDYPAGSYVHNPVGSSHTPGSEPGCTIFVKLHWMDPNDQATVRTIANDAAWGDVAVGVRQSSLHRFGEQHAALVELDTAGRLQRESPGGLEILVLEGDCAIDGVRLRQHGWARRPPGSKSVLESTGGCRLFVKEGHLATPPPLPTTPPDATTGPAR